jgi:hypothetical protein
MSYYGLLSFRLFLKTKSRERTAGLTGYLQTKSKEREKHKQTKEKRIKR